MARIFKDSSVLNQFGSPSINSNTFANRPAAGQVGRLFVDTTNNIIQRDTGSGWVTVSGSGATPNLQAVTGVGNTSTNGIFLGSSGSLTAGKLLEVKGSSLFTGVSGNLTYIGIDTITPNNSTLDVYGYTSHRNVTGSSANLGSIVRNDYNLQLNGTAITNGDPSGSINQLTLNNLSVQTLGNSTPGVFYIGAGLNKNFVTDDGTSLNVVTVTQNAGGITAISPLQSISQYDGLGGSSLTHYAGAVINGFKATNGSAITITNNYQLLINSSQQFSGSTTITNRWGIYQAGANDVNYLNGNTIIGSSTPIDNGNKLQVTGNIVPTLSYSYTLGTSSLHFTNVYAQTLFNSISPTLGITASQGIISFSTKANTGEIARFENETGNLLLGTITNTNAVKLKVNGEQEWSNITYGTGVHTTSGNHLPIWVNGTKYWLALLNPPVLP